MNVLVLILLALIGGSFADEESGCDYDFRAIFTWTDDKLYSAVPWVFSNYSIVESMVGLNDAQMEETRVAGLEWLQKQFGLPIETATFDHVTNTTTIPNWGSYVAEIFPVNGDSCYSLTSTSLDHFGTPGTVKFLVVAEFNFQPFPSAFNTIIYGGRFAELYSKFSMTPFILSGDTLSYGYYYIYELIGSRPVFLKRVIFKSKFPTRGDMPFRHAEESYLEDEDWGCGTSTLRLKFAEPNGAVFIQFDGLWKFPEFLDIYTLYGIPM